MSRNRDYGSVADLPGFNERDERSPGALKTFVSNNVGLLLVAASELFFACMHLAVKILNSIDPPVSTFELIFVRMVITYVFSVAYMVWTGVSNPVLGPPGVRWLLFCRGIGGSIGLYGIYYSLQYLSLSDATVLTFLSPMCTAIAGAMFLGEHLRVSQLVAGVFSLGGVVLIARPPWLFGDSSQHNVGDEDVTPAQRLTAVGVALIGVLGATLAFTSLRAIGKRAHTMHSMVSFAGQSIIFSGVAMLVTRTEFIIPAKTSWLAMLLMIGVFGFIAQILLTMGLQRETAGRGTMAVYTQIVFATILQRIFLKTTPPLLSIVGTVIIVVSALYTALSKVKDKEVPLVSETDEERGLLDDPEENR
ncbi:integral membrane protein DUF6 [Coprinopsis cinerea okayama7|uniref:Integral membrane protein DUF6 n=1 Tax=Coprinopsis cinerea (strain Okayama-7 / 130 / ATCC MYA-4618 / FGSC 9003) TaxID=240176 RepID=A8P2G5_COPC7|nr:integral membrane protein DUF6 [Coprinopsis cinerea okayama7\|eukprot:XP_001838315.2 integral membrane protein DUF6 [Coprinopsis cinerea okayama7\